MSSKLKIIARAVNIRLNNGESLHAILSSYPSLTEEEKAELNAYFKEGDTNENKGIF